VTIISRSPRGRSRRRHVTAPSIVCLCSIAFAPLLSAEWKALGPFGGSAAFVQSDPNNAKTILAAAPNGHLWLQGSLTTKGHPARMWQSSGRTWAQVAIPANVCQPGTSGFCPLQISGQLVYDGASGAWAGPFAHWTGTHWVNADNYFPQLIPGFDFHAFTVFPGTSGIWAAGVIDTSAAGGFSDLIARFY